MPCQVRLETIWQVALEALGQVSDIVGEAALPRGIAAECEYDKILILPHSEKIFRLRVSARLCDW